MEIRSARDGAAGIPSPRVFSCVVSSSALSARRVTAILEADSAEAAVQRVREVVGDDCEVVPAQFVGPGRSAADGIAPGTLPHEAA
jgi:hypothetical protein